ncbi:MAG TPA: hypothetical protein DIS77_10065 [Rothia sp.]|nr:hypothetical protein [Rothia sp. (in: high G+C Gram-positive bacteria)]
MKKHRLTLPFFTSSSRTVFLTIGALVPLILTGCSGAGQENSPAESEPAKASASPTTSASAAPKDSAEESQDASSTEENFVGSKELADAQEVPLDAAEVQITEKLYTEVQRVLSSIEAVDVNTSDQASPNTMDEGAENTDVDEEIDPYKYVSEATVDELKKTTTGSALDQYVATATEYAMSGWRVEGTSQVVGNPRLTDGEYEGQPSKLLEVCLDSSDVKVLNVAGTQMNPTGQPRSLNIFTLIEDHGAWKIASQDFPNNADC